MVTKTLVRVSDGAILSTVPVTAPNDENRNNYQPSKKNDGSKSGDGKKIAANETAVMHLLGDNMSNSHVTKTTDEKKSTATGKRRSTRQKRPVVFNDDEEEEDTGSDRKKRRREQKGEKFIIDLKGVAMQQPILKHGGKTNGSSSKYVGVYWVKSTDKWRAQITIDGKIHHVGYYDNEEDAAADYARAVFKYNGGKDVIESLRAQLSRKGSLEKIDLADVPKQQLIMKPNGKGSSTSKYKGVTFHKASNKWLAEITIDGKRRYVGCYDNEEDAAADYARAVFKYKGGSNGIKRLKTQQSRMTLQEKIDLKDVPMQVPILKHDGKTDGLSSKYLGVCWDKSRKKWLAQICVDGKQRHIGHYDSEEVAATDYARAVFKYKGESDGIERVKTQQRGKASLEKIDLADVPKQQLIMKSNGKGSSTSKYKGVTFLKASNKWVAQITFDGKQRRVGCYDNEEDAAADYARAVFKYKGGSAEVERQYELQQLPLNLIQVPAISPAGYDPIKGGPISALKVTEYEI